MRETDNTALQRCALCVDTRAGALSETGDLIMPIREGAIGDLLDLGQTERRLIELGVHPLVVLRHQADMLASTSTLAWVAAEHSAAALSTAIWRRDMRMGRLGPGRRGYAEDTCSRGSAHQGPAQSRAGMARPRITAGRERKASNARRTWGKRSICTSSPAS